MSGTINLFHEPTVGPVSGIVNNEDHLSLEGTATNAEHQAEIKIERWDTYIDTSGDRMLGTWDADSVFANGFGLQHQKEHYELLTVQRVPQ